MRFLALVLAAALVLAGCDGARQDQDAPTNAVSGELGVVTEDDAERAVQALCELRGTADAAVARRVFLDRAHQVLHAIAAAAEDVDREIAGRLLVATERVEAEVSLPRLPPSFPEDVAELERGTVEALGAVGLDVAPCG